jgi:hypothetical protein
LGLARPIEWWTLPIPINLQQTDFTNHSLVKFKNIHTVRAGNLGQISTLTLDCGAMGFLIA